MFFLMMSEKNKNIKAKKGIGSSPQDRHRSTFHFLSKE